MASSPASPDPSTPLKLARPTFADADLQHRFERDGFVVVPALEAADLEAVRRVWTETSAGTQQGFVSDVIGRSDAASELIEEVVGPIIDRALDEVLLDHERFVVSYLTKWPGDDSALGLHQDWTYADERYQRTVSFWIALDDASTSLDNGPVRVIPGSHRFVDAYRGPSVLDWFGDLRSEMEALLVPVEVRAGEAIVLDNAILHDSSQNRSSAPRRAVAAAAAPEGTRFVFVEPTTGSDRDEVSIVDLGERYLSRYDPSAPVVDARREIGRSSRILSADVRRLGELVERVPADLADAPSPRRMSSSVVSEVLEVNAAVLAREHRAARARGWAPVPAQMLRDWTPITETGPAEPECGSIYPLASGRAATQLGASAHPLTVALVAHLPGTLRVWVAEVAPGQRWHIAPLVGDHLTAMILEPPAMAGVVRVHAGGGAVGEAGVCQTADSMDIENAGNAPAAALVVETAAGRWPARRATSSAAILEADEYLAALNPAIGSLLAGGMVER